MEKNEKTKDSRLAREFVPALPIELTPSQWQELLTDFIQNNFVADGMCADVAVHVHLTSHHLRQRKPLVLVTLISAIGTGGLVFSDCLHAADLESCLCKILGPR